jgi:hypothetical protein
MSLVSSCSVGSHPFHLEGRTALVVGIAMTMPAQKNTRKTGRFRTGVRGNAGIPLLFVRAMCRKAIV